MYLILWTPESRGKPNYAVPDYPHGDVHPGPYLQEWEARLALQAFVRDRIDPNCQEGYENNFEIFKLTKV